jgi:hypothetical protein
VSLGITVLPYFVDEGMRAYPMPPTTVLSSSSGDLALQLAAVEPAFADLEVRAASALAATVSV